MSGVLLNTSQWAGQQQSSICPAMLKVEKPCSASELPHKIHLNTTRKTASESTAIGYAQTINKTVKEAPIFAHLPAKTSKLGVGQDLKSQLLSIDQWLGSRERHLPKVMQLHWAIPHSPWLSTMAWLSLKPLARNVKINSLCIRHFL